MLPTDELSYLAAIVATRMNRGITQAALAAAMKERGHSWHQATVWSVEKGDRAIRLGEAVSLSEILGVPLPDISDSERRAEIADEIQRLSQQLKRLAAEL